MSKMIEDLFGVEKVIIGMVHFSPLPGSPLYNDEMGIEGIERWIQNDLENLQDGGVDAIMFCNEGDRPYVLEAPPATIAAMAYVIGRVRDRIRLPFGVDILWDPKATIALAKSVGAQFVREVFTGVYESDMGIWNPQCGEIWRYKRLVEANNLKLFYNITAELGGPLSSRGLENAAKAAVLSSLADAVLVSGTTAGIGVNVDQLALVKKAVLDTPVFANTGVNMQNVEAILSVADGAIVGSSLKVDGNTWNPVDRRRVEEFMKKVNYIRKK